MPVEIREMNGGEGLHIVFSGTAVYQEYVEAVSQLQSHAERLGASLKFVFSDFLLVEKLSWTTSEVYQLAKASVDSAHTELPLIIATVSEDPLAFGMIRVWEVVSEETGYTTQTFGELGAARSWVNDQMMLRYGVGAPSFQDTAVLVPTVDLQQT